MEKEEPLPTRDFAFDLLKKLKVPYQVRKHSIKVAEKALEIADKINKADVNRDLIEIDWGKNIKAKRTSRKSC